MSRISSSSAIVAAVCIALALPACKGKSPSKKQAAASETGTKPHKLTPREEQQQEIELWEASVQKLRGELARAHAHGDELAARDFEKKLQVSMDGLQQAKDRLELMEQVHDAKHGDD